MAAPGASSLPNGIGNNQAAIAQALMGSLQPEKRHEFLQPSAVIPDESLQVVKDTLEAFAGQVGDEQQRKLREASGSSRKRKRGGDKEDVLKVRRVYVDGFETDQVWEQAKRIIGGVLKFSEKTLEELEEKNEVVMNGDVNGEIGEVDSESGEEDDLGSLQDAEEDLEDDDEDLDADGLLGDDMEDDFDEADAVDGLQDEGEEEDDDSESDGPDEEFVEDPNGLNDGFFSIDDFNKQSQWFEDQDAKGDPNTDQNSDEEDIDWAADPLAASSKTPEASKRRATDAEAPLDQDESDDDEEDGPTFGNMDLNAPEGESEDEAMDDDVDDEGNDFNANEVYYKDFFAPPPRKRNGDKPMKKKKKGVRFEQDQPDEADMERAMADVRRDLFDDESDNGESDDALSDVSAGDPRSRRSTHERRQAKLAEEIRKLEAASVAKREWTVSGEAAAADRPMNSLLEEDLDFEHVGKPVPVITPEVTEGIEDLIKRRILAQEFDEVLRRRPGTESMPAATGRRGLQELDDGKPQKGLAEVYEEEHVKSANPDSYVSQSDEKLQREEREVEAMWRDVSAKLDGLSSWHYKPKPAAPSLSVVADVATIGMEDAQPATAQGVGSSGGDSRLAPQEIYKAGGKDNTASGEVVSRSGLPVAREEMTREDKAARRRRDKERARKAGGSAGGNAPQSAKAKQRQDTMADLKKGGVKVINRKGEITDVQGKKPKAAKVASSGSYKL